MERANPIPEQPLFVAEDVLTSEDYRNVNRIHTKRTSHRVLFWGALSVVILLPSIVTFLLLSDLFIWDGFPLMLAVLLWIVSLWILLACFLQRTIFPRIGTARRMKLKIPSRQLYYDVSLVVECEGTSRAIPYQQIKEITICGDYMIFQKIYCFTCAHMFPVEEWPRFVAFMQEVARKNHIPCKTVSIQQK